MTSILAQGGTVQHKLDHAVFIHDLFDPRPLQQMLDDGFVRQATSGPLALYNYSDKTQWERNWNPVTLQCRGLIVDQRTQTVFARPFPKFFNYIEGQLPIPPGPIRVTDKLDGSLGVLYLDPVAEQYKIATRGSFDGAQAVWASAWLQERMRAGWSFVPGKTYLFEIIYPHNRVVVDYGQRAELVLLEVLDNRISLPDREAYDALPCTKAETFAYASLPDLLAAAPRPNAEGFVVYFESDNTRLKIKQDEYVRLHKLLTGLSVKSIWESLSQGKDAEAICADVPDEFFDWVRKQSAALMSAFREVQQKAEQEFRLLSDAGLTQDRSRESRKAFAQRAAKSPYSGLLFTMYDNGSIEPEIWKRIKPRGAQTFRKDEDA